MKYKLTEKDIKELRYATSEDGMEVDLYFAPKSKYLLEMELNNTNITTNDLQYE